MAYRSPVHESVSQTSFRVSIRRKMRVPIDFLYPTSMGFRCPQTFVVHRRQQLISDKKARPSYKGQDFELVHSPVVKSGQSTKLKNHWIGLFFITKKTNDVKIFVQNSDNGKNRIVHSDRFKCYNKSFKEKSSTVPKKMPPEKQVALSIKTTEPPRVEDLEIQSDCNDLFVLELDERSNQVQQPQPRSSSRDLTHRQATSPGKITKMTRSPRSFLFALMFRASNGTLIG